MLFTFTATSNGVLAASSALIGPASHVIWASPPPGSCALSENGNLEVTEKPVTVMFTWSYTLNLREEFVLPTVSLPSVTFNFATERFGVLDSPGLDSAGFLLAAPPRLEKFQVPFASFNRVISGFSSSSSVT